MKKIFYLLFIPLFLFSKSPQCEGYLLSSPRSGNTWIRYCIEHLTEYNTHPIPRKTPTKTSKLPLFSLLDSKSLDAPYFQKLHIFSSDEKKQNKKIILLVRNYKEIFCRYASFPKESINQCELTRLLNELRTNQSNYIHNLECYDKWSVNNRLLLYYEDIITYPQESLEKLVNFLGGNIHDLEEFMMEYEDHKKRAIHLYNTKIQRSITNGTAELYHSKKMSPNSLKAIDKLIMTTYPELARKYLLRYQ